jgi:hypothetical protein
MPGVGFFSKQGCCGHPRQDFRNAPFHGLFKHKGPRMAKWCVTLVIAAVMLVLVGCQSTSSVSMVQNLPPPNFDGPGDLTARPALPPPAPVRAPVGVAPRVPSPAGPGLNVPTEWLPPIRANNWRWIVIHHSATPNGGASAFDRMHKDKHWDELGYHFVIGNGTDTRDGQVEVGPRWRKQKWGAHAKTPDNRYNDYGIGICLVGNFQVTRPTWKQVDAVAKLVAHLQQTYNIPSDRVIGHQMVRHFDRGGTSTDCPGRNLNVAQIRQLSGKRIAEAGGAVPIAHTAAAAAGSELLYDERTSH